MNLDDIPHNRYCLCRYGFDVRRAVTSMMFADALVSNWNSILTFHQHFGKAPFLLAGVPTPFIRCPFCEVWLVIISVLKKYSYARQLLFLKMSRFSPILTISSSRNMQSATKHFIFEYGRFSGATDFWRTQVLIRFFGCFLALANINAGVWTLESSAAFLPQRSSVNPSLFDFAQNFPPGDYKTYWIVKRISSETYNSSSNCSAQFVQSLTVHQLVLALLVTSQHYIFKEENNEEWWKIDCEIISWMTVHHRWNFDYGNSADCDIESCHLWFPTIV